MPTSAPDTDVRRIADEAVRRARGFTGWRAYEAAKSFVRREYPGHDQYDAIIDAIQDRLEI